MINTLIIKKELENLNDIIYNNVEIKNIFYEKIPEDEKIDKSYFPLVIYNLQNFKNNSILSTIGDSVNYNIILTFIVKIYSLDILESFEIAEKLNNILLNNNYSCSLVGKNEQTGFETTCVVLTIQKLIIK